MELFTRTGEKIENRPNYIYEMTGEEIHQIALLSHARSTITQTQDKKHEYIT